ncbi:MAG: acyl-CoA dehydrogenase family protein [Rhizobacter sp.]
MDFQPTEEQRAFESTARSFAAAELAPHAATWDRESTFPRDTIRRAASLGFCGLYAPESIGGLALSRLDSTFVFEALAGADPSTTAFLTIHNMVTWMLGTWGSEGVRARWGQALTRGDKLGSYCLTEPGAGSDAASLQTRAERTAQGYVIHGGKAFISGAGATDVLVVMARTGGPGAGGISAFVVPADAPGVGYGQNEPKMGWHSQPTRSVSFDGVDIPEDHRLGGEGEGFRLAMQGLDGGRINIATCSVGAAQAALDTARNYLHEREQFGRPLASQQALQFRLADMATELVAARQMVRLAASQLDRGSPDATAYCAMAKRFATDAGFKVCNEALQLHGGYGYLNAFPLERLVRDTRVHQILEGTNEIMRLIVARRLLDHDAELR